jgi:hypothetical protein
MAVSAYQFVGCPPIKMLSFGVLHCCEFFEYIYGFTDILTLQERGKIRESTARVLVYKMLWISLKRKMLWIPTVRPCETSIK